MTINVSNFNCHRVINEAYCTNIHRIGDSDPMTSLQRVGRWSGKADKTISILCMPSSTNGYKNGHEGSGSARICKGRSCECLCHKGCVVP